MSQNLTGRHLLLVAHGSRRQASNDEVRELAARVSQRRGADFDAVTVAFLELSEPSIPAGLAACVANGAREIVLFPYFLAAGTHVVADIPEAIAEFQARHPDIVVRLTPHLGASAALPDAILTVAGGQ